MTIIKAQYLTKFYHSKAAVSDVTFSVSKGDTYGICGNRGAGKSTLLNLLAGSSSPSSGEVFLFNKPSGDKSVQQRLGVYNEHSEIHHHLTGMNHLLNFSSRQKKRASEDKCLELLRAVNLYDAAYVKVDKYTRDMQKRLLLAQSIVHDPEVLLFDEPTQGLGDTSVRYIHQFIEELKLQGKTIIMAFEKLDELANLCTTISLMQNGRMMKEGSKEDLYAAYGHSITASFKLSKVTNKEKQTLIPLISQFAEILYWTNHVLSISIQHDYYIPVVVRALVNERIDVFRIEVDEPDLDDLLYGSKRI
ncbi:ATP-binding cassette domain-containing protein [Bacillus gobiensis]|uniref:ATP-binding cassette domain-containing protein n=1 Tax=Bacillus gobiensis TaxID=1441095 RepID=UPI003D227446